MANKLRKIAVSGVVAMLVLLGSPKVHANPVEPHVAAGAAAFEGLNTAALTIRQHTPQAIINWRQFNIAPNEVTQFIQPSSSAIALNRIADVHPSQIFGSLQANGIVMLLNPNGVLFGPNAQVNVGGLIASSLKLTDSQFLNGEYRFQGTAMDGPVRNAGTITAGKDGVYLLAPNVENNGVITSPEGHIALAAGSTAYLSKRADGRGLLVEVTAPEGEALNLKDLVADGGQVSMIGRVVKQQGLVQANSVREKNGRIELYASDQLQLNAGSRTVARGADEGVSDGGTVIALADKTTGLAQFERDALIDVSGGKQGGNAGFAELSGSTVQVGGRFVGKAAEGYEGGKVLIDPTDFTADTGFFNSFAGSGLSEIKAEADRDIRVTGFVDLSFGNNLPAGTEGKLVFEAGQDLLFQQFQLFNDLLGTGQPTKWSLEGTAGRDVVVRQSNVSTNYGGSIDLRAGRDFRLEDSFGTDRTFLWTWGGGGITLEAGRDVVIPNGFDPNFRLVAGVRSDGRGDVRITAGRDVLGGTNFRGQKVGPGFMIADGEAVVTAGGTIGTADHYANLTVGKAEVKLDAVGDVYVGLVQDKGAVEVDTSNPTALFTGQSSTASRVVMADPGNRLEVTSHEGDLFFKPLRLQDTDPDIVRFYPASLVAEAKKGNIIFEEGFSFWPSLTGTISLKAHQNIEGRRFVTGFVRDPTFQEPICAGRVCTVQELLLTGLAKTEQEANFLLTPRFIQGQIQVAPTIEISPADPRAIAGKEAGSQALEAALLAPATNLPDHAPAPISLTTEIGDIRAIALGLYAGETKKQVTIVSGKDISQFTAILPTYEGLTTEVRAIGDFDMSKLAAGTSGLTFIGKGTARVSVGGNLDLADSSGIEFRVSRAPSGLANQGGLLELIVGKNVEMAQSKLFTYNGASVFVHGHGTEPIASVEGTFVGPSLFVAGKRLLTAAEPIPDNPPVIRDGEIVLSGGRPVLRDGRPVTRGRAVLADGKPVTYEGNLILFLDGQLVFVDPAIVREVKPIDGFINVGANAAAGQDSGIVTVRGGNIDLKAAGDVNVNRSRVATLGGGEIGVTSTIGDINAGSGGRNEVTSFPIDEPDIDPLTGQQRQKPDGSLAFIRTVFQVPGSGIFTFHPNDPAFPLPFPEFDTAQLTALKNEAAKQSFLGRDTSAIRAEILALTEQRAPEFERIFDDFVAPLKLGDITLQASRDIVVPPAGIRGRKILLRAGRFLDLQGGTIEGQTVLEAEAIKGDNSAVRGVFSSTTSSGTATVSSSGSGGTVAPLSGTTSATASSSATAGTSSTASGNSNSVQESGGEAGAAQNVQAARELVARTIAQKDEPSKPKMARAKQGVTIQVEAKARH